MVEKQKLSSTMRIDLIPDMGPGHEGGGGRQPTLKSAPGGHQQRTAGALAHAPASSHYERLLQSLYDAAIVSNLSGRILDANVRACEFLGHNMAGLRELHVFDVISGADDALLDTVCENLTNERHTLIQAFCLRADQSYFPAEIAVSLLHLDQERLCFFIRDITLRRQAEEMLMTEHRAIQNSGNGIAVTDLDGNVAYANTAAEKLWEASPEQGLAGRSMLTLFTDPEAIRAVLDALRAEGEGAIRCELVACRPNQSTCEVRLSGARNRNSEGEAIGFVFSIEDSRDRKRAEEAERESERRRVMIESLGAACHHLGQPSTVLLGTLELLKDRLNPGDQEAHRMVASSLQAMEEIVQVLRRLTAVDTYRTREYLRASEGPVRSGAVSILEI